MTVRTPPSPSGQTQDTKRRIITPADVAWDDVFDTPGIDLGTRRQPGSATRSEAWVSEVIFT